MRTSDEALKEYKARTDKMPEQFFAEDEKDMRDIYIAIDAIYDIPEKIADYLNGEYENGFPHSDSEETQPGKLHIWVGALSGNVRFPKGRDEQESEKIRKGAEKFLLLNLYQTAEREGLL